MSFCLNGQWVIELTIQCTYFALLAPICVESKPVISTVMNNLCKRFVLVNIKSRGLTKHYILQPHDFCFSIFWRTAYLRSSSDHHKISLLLAFLYRAEFTLATHFQPRHSFLKNLLSLCSKQLRFSSQIRYSPALSMYDLLPNAKI